MQSSKKNGKALIVTIIQALYIIILILIKMFDLIQNELDKQKQLFDNDKKKEQKRVEL